MTASAKTRRKTGAEEPQGFHLASLDKADAPAGTDADNWYRYVIRLGDNEIVGHRQGSLKSVKSAVEETIVRLNERRLGKSGRVHLTPGPRKGRQ
jgi:hypothetical protein